MADFTCKGFGFKAIIINHNNNKDYDKDLAEGNKTDMEWTAGSWDMDFKTAREAEYLISVAHGGVIQGIYKVNDYHFHPGFLRNKGVAEGNNLERIDFEVDYANKEVWDSYVGKTVKPFYQPWATSWKGQ